MNKVHFIIALALSVITGAYGVACAKDLISPNVTVVDKYTIKGPKHFHTGYEPGDADGNLNVVIEIPNARPENGKSPCRMEQLYGKKRMESQEK